MRGWRASQTPRRFPPSWLSTSTGAGAVRSARVTGVFGCAPEGGVEPGWRTSSRRIAVCASGLVWLRLRLGWFGDIRRTARPL